MAATPLTRSGSESYDILTILDLARNGAIRVPDFQRAYVWDASDVIRLFDSIYRGFPIGTILLWNRAGLEEKIRFGPVEVDAEARPDALWVVDGQQRLTSLFGCLARENAGIDDRFEVYFNLATQKFINPQRGVIPARAIPVREAVETRSLLNWLRQHDAELESEDLDIADRLGGVLRDYKISAYVVSGDDQNLLREVFDRVNSAGKPISRAQIFHALFASGEYSGSPAGVVEELTELNFGEIDENRVVQSLLAIRGGNVQRDLHGEFEDGENVDYWYDETTRALSFAINFLKSQGVPHLALMPNTLPIPVLAAFFHLHPEPQSWNLRLLSRWLWRGWAHGFGKEGGQTPVLRRAIQSVNPGRSIEEIPSEYSALESLLQYVPNLAPPKLPLTNFSTRSANGRLILLSLVALHPLAVNGKKLKLDELFDLKGVRAITDFVSESRTNAAARGFWQDRLNDLERSPHATLRSHALTKEAVSSLLQRDRQKFLDLRSKILRRTVDDFLDNRLEPKALMRPSLDDILIVGAGEDEDGS